MVKLIAVAVGVVPGIYPSWKMAQSVVVGHSKAEYKGFENLNEAIDYMTRYHHFQIKIFKEDGTYHIHQNSGTEEVISSNISLQQYSMLPPHYDIYTDGSADNNNKMVFGGIGVIVLDCSMQHILISTAEPVSVLPNCTNNYAELMAVRRGLDFVLSYPKGIRINWYTDSTYVINQLVSRPFLPGSPQYPITTECINILNAVTLEGTCIRFIHVDAHSGDKYNEMVDTLARGAFQTVRF